MGLYLLRFLGYFEMKKMSFTIANYLAEAAFRGKLTKALLVMHPNLDIGCLPRSVQALLNTSHFPVV